MNTNLYSDTPMSIRILNAKRSARILTPVDGFESSATAQIYRQALEFAQDRGATVCLVSYPLTNLLYENMIPIVSYAMADRFFQGLAEKFGAVRLNLRGLRLPDKYFSDSHHLNHTGATHVSGIIERDYFPN